MDIQVIEIDAETGKVSFKLSAKPVTGIKKLVQAVILSLFNTPGKDVLNPEWGSGIQDMVSMNFSEDDASEITAELTRKLRKTEGEIQKRQIGLSLPAGERLKELRLMGLRPSSENTEIFATVRIISDLGQQTDIVV